MNLKIKILLVLINGLGLLHATVYAQNSVSEINSSIKKIESYLYQNPTLGKADLLSLLEKNPSAPDSSKGIIYLKLATAWGMINRLDSAIWAANQSIDLLNHKMEKVHAIKMKAILFRIKGEYQQAESAIKESLTLNDSIWKNQPLKATILQEYASLNLDQNKFYNATQLYLKALETMNAPDYKDPNGAFNRLKIQINLAEAYLQSGNPDYAINNFQKVLPKLDSLKDYDGYIRAGYHLAEAYIQTKQYGLAERLNNKLLSMAIELKNEELKSYIILTQGLSLSHQQKYGEGIPYYRKAFKLLEKNQSSYILECTIHYLTALKNTNGIEEGLKIIKNQSVKTAMNSSSKVTLLNYRKIAVNFIWKELTAAQLHAYYQDIVKLSDSVNKESQQQQALELQAKYQFEEQEKNTKTLAKENTMLRSSENYKRKQIYLIIIISTLLIVTILLLMARVRQRVLIQAQELEVQKKENELQKQQTSWALQEKNYRDQLLEQQKILLIQTLADSDELKIKLNQMVEEQELDRRKELMKQFEKTKEGKIDLDKLLVQFNYIHPAFTSSLLNTYPKLTQSDLQFCILYRMNISTKEIAILLNVEQRSIYAKKYRIAEKMELGKEEDFDKIIFDLK